MTVHNEKITDVLLNVVPRQNVKKIRHITFKDLVNTVLENSILSNSLSVFYFLAKARDRKHTTRLIKIISNLKPWEIQYISNKMFCIVA